MVPLDSLEVLDKLIARVTYDPKTGTMSADPLVAADGTGLALALGYEVGKDLFAKINPGRFDLLDMEQRSERLVCSGIHHRRHRGARGQDRPL